MKAKGKLKIDMKDLLRKTEMILRVLINMRLESRYRAIFIGGGLEFEEFKNYSPGEDAKNIDWKVSMRINELVVRKYREERELDVYFLVDASNSMIFGSAEKLKLEYNAEFVAAFAYFVSKVGDKPGLIMFSDTVKKFVPPGMGDNHFRIILSELINMKNYGGGYDLRKAVRFLMNVSRRKGIAIIASDFIGLREGWEESIRLLSTKFDVVGIMVRDVRDEKLVRVGRGFLLQDPFSEKKEVIVPEKIKEEYESYVREEEKRIKNVFTSVNADFFKLLTRESFVIPLVKFFIQRGMRKFLL